MILKVLNDTDSVAFQVEGLQTGVLVKILNLDISYKKKNGENNNNDRFLHSALHTLKGVSKRFHIITPGHWALILSLNHLSSLESIQPVQPNM